jgi:hypothetical protein
MALIDDVIKLDLGPDTTAVLGRIGAYLDRLDARMAAEDSEEGTDGGASGGAPQDPAGASSPKGKLAEGASKARAAAEALRADGLVALGLPAPQYRTLAALREAAAALSGPGGAADAAGYDRAAGLVKSAAGQLGEIGAAIQVGGCGGLGGESHRGHSGQAGARAVLQGPLSAATPHRPPPRSPMPKRPCPGQARGHGRRGAARDDAGAEGPGRRAVPARAGGLAGRLASPASTAVCELMGDTMEAAPAPAPRPEAARSPPRRPDTPFLTCFIPPPPSPPRTSWRLRTPRVAPRWPRCAR